MNSIFVNFSNHPSDTWNDSQIRAALKYADQIIDIPFPDVDPNMSEAELFRLAEKATGEILSLNPAAVMCQGEFGLSFSVIKRLLDAGVIVVHACSTREVHVEKDVKTVRFQFVQFRKYQ